MSNRHRLGVALVLPQPVRTEVDGVRRAFGLVGRGRMPPHITLAGPVNVRGDRLDEVLDRLRDLAAQTRPLQLQFGPTATFGPESDVGFLSVTGPDLDELQALRRRVHVEPLVRDDRPFVPHVTVTERRVDVVLAATADWSFDARCASMSVFEELVIDTGRRWVLLDEFGFAAPAVIGRGGLELTLHTHWRGELLCIDALRSKRAVGRASLWLPSSGDSARLLALDVDEAVRREGIGRHLVERAVDEARQLGARVIVADAHGFLRELGWSGEGTEISRVLRSAELDRSDSTR
ncbi:MAG: GNAT family N-acetyltransferase [Acidimicrobiia bacterium]